MNIIINPTTIGIISLVTVSQLYEYPYIVLIALLCYASLWLVLLKKDSRFLMVFLIAGLLGPSAEIVSIYFGAWHYTQPQFFGIPVWLPVLWGLAGVVTVHIYRNLPKK